ncbi:S-layer homology domain-containing protein [uncultured Intestinimonas sp.]|uniref:S-layer homology domain-containing protein n=1 Tax=uncultured Intestinimonas sp. TaxID=1689265 RepID=UPI002602BB7F|nr:S-layer homology domain-containing protein [uncultured Intestinimonas sp.]
MKKRIVSLLLAGVMAASALPGIASAAGLSNFQKSNTYTPGQFADVPAGSWFAAGVQSAYELGLMTGTSDTAFIPSGKLSLAEAVALAARLHSIYVGDNADFSGGDPWYQSYVDYAIQNGIIAAGAYSTYVPAATRAQFASILAAALPDEALPAINSVASLPDVPANATYAAAALKLYNAGILTGSDAAGTFNPESSIQRSEVATIVTRMADQSQRKTFTLSAAQTQAPAVSSTTKKFDGMLTQDDIQGTWYAHRDPSLTSIVPAFQFDNEEEIIFNGNQFTYVRHSLDNDDYFFLTGTYTMTSEPYNGDPNICHVTLNINYGDCYSNETGEGFELNDFYTNTTGTRTFNANLTMPEDCFVFDGSTFTRADAQPVYLAYQTAFNSLGVQEPEPDMPDTDYVLYDGLPVPDFGALYGIEPLPEEDSDIRLPGEMQALIDAAEALTADMITFTYSAPEAQEAVGGAFPPAIDPFFFTDYEAVLEECGFKGEYRDTYGGRQFFYVGYGYLVSYDVYHLEENYYTFDLPQRYNSDTITILIQPD